MHHLRFDGLRSMTDDKSHQTTSQSSHRSRPIICVCVKRAHCSRASKKKLLKISVFKSILSILDVSRALTTTKYTPK